MSAVCGLSGWLMGLLAPILRCRRRRRVIRAPAGLVVRRPLGEVRSFRKVR